MSSSSSSFVSWSVSFCFAVVSGGCGIGFTKLQISCGICGKESVSGIITAFKNGVQSTFFQKVLICAFAGFLAASLVEWAKVFVEGADDALNKGYKHRAVMDTTK